MTEQTKLITGIERSVKAYLDKYTLPFIAAADHPPNIPTRFLKIARKRSEKGNLKFLGTENVMQRGIRKILTFVKL